MPASFDPQKKKAPSTYFVQDNHKREELTRLTIQDQMVTGSVGGVLPEQTDPTVFQRILDVGCGPGGWVLETARTYPTISLVGVDINQKMIEHASEQARAEQLTGRVSFQVMDALRYLTLPSARFDLVNMRLAVSFVRTWDWPAVLREFCRVTVKGGVIRLTEADIAETNSPALTTLNQMLRQAFYNAGNFFTLSDDGLTSQLVPLLTRHGLTAVQAQAHSLICRADTPEGQSFVADMRHLYQTVQPFIQKWTRVLDGYDALYQQAIQEMQREDFLATWRFVTAWGKVPGSQVIP